MNYRHKLLNQQAKNQIAQKEQAWQQEKTILQQDIINLQNSTDLKLLEQAQAEAKKLQKLLDDTVNLLGSSDIKNLTDLSNLLKGKSLKELTTEKDLLSQKIHDQDTALINLAKQKIKGKKEAEALINELETKWSKKEIEWEQEKKQQKKEREQWATLLASKKEQSRLELNKQLDQQKQTSFAETQAIKNNYQEQLKTQQAELNSTHQEQLKKINTLFDENAVHYANIDFNGLYNLLTEIRNLNQNADLLKEYKEKQEGLEIKINSQQTLLGEIKETLNGNWVVFKGKDKLLKKITEENEASKDL